MDEFVKMRLLDGPVWQDGCAHGPECYVASFENIDRFQGQMVLEKLDLYVWQNPGPMGQEVCLRYGNEAHEYYSPGRTVDVVKLAHVAEKYNLAVQILLARGKIVWIPNEK